MGALELLGKVVSTAMQKTVKVEIKRWWTHPKYNVRVVRRTHKLAHDEVEKCMVGDMVKIQECKPLSKMKAFKVIELVQPVPKYLDPETNKLHTNPHVKNTFVNPEVFKKIRPKPQPEPFFDPKQ